MTVMAMAASLPSDSDSLTPLPSGALQHGQKISFSLISKYRPSSLTDGGHCRESAGKGRPGQVGCGNIWHVDRHPAGRAGRTRHLARRYPDPPFEGVSTTRWRLRRCLRDFEAFRVCRHLSGQGIPRVARDQGNVFLIGITFEILIRMEG